MRFTSSLFIATALTLSVNAAIWDRRSVSVPFQLCRDSVDSVSLQIDVVTTALGGFSTSSGHLEVVALLRKEQVLESNLHSVEVNCCGYADIVTDEEAEAMLSTASPVISKAIYSLAVVKSMRNQFNPFVLSASYVKSSLAKFNSQTVAIYNCILSIASVQQPSYINIIDDYIDQLDFAFADTRAAYANA